MVYFKGEVFINLIISHKLVFDNKKTILCGGKHSRVRKDFQLKLMN